MAEIQQIEPQQVAGEGELRCHSCGARNVKRSIFCNACGYYLKKRAYIAILLLMTAATAIAASLILTFEEGWFWQLLAIILVGASALRWVLLGLFGWKGERYEEWKARRGKKRELTGQSP
jgi:ribosomal protein L37AE/L43A